MKTILATLLFAVCLMFPCAHAQQSEKVREYRAKADQGDATAQFNLGRCYDLGQGVDQYNAAAAEWYSKAAQQGLADAQFWLGVCYLNGHGVQQDFAAAVQWYRKAAEQGHAQSQNELGRCYHKGVGVTQNIAEALWWYRKAADQGNADAQYNLGYCYENGQGVEQNIPEAEKWYRKADQRETAAKAVSVVAGANSTGIDMVSEGGVLKAPVQLNGAISLKFVVDSGASDVQVPKDVVSTLIRAETIQEKDFLPGKVFVLADGTKVKSDRFMLRSIKVGELTFSDVEASIGGLKAELLLGQSFLSKFTEWKIDNKNGKLILTK